MRCLPTAYRSLREAMMLAPTLLDAARQEGRPWMAGSLVEGPAILLGAAQRAGRVVKLAACAEAGISVFRRATTGTAVHLGGRGVVWTLALPDVAALAHDATARTVLNRNVRFFLKGFGRAGVQAHYFGREWISIRRRPAAVIAAETTVEGAVVLEVWSGLDASLALPGRCAAPEELVLDRWLGKQPAALAEVLPAGVTPEILVEEVLVGIAAAAQVTREPVELRTGELSGLVDGSSGFGLPSSPPVAVSLERVPIGWIEAETLPAGDSLASESATRETCPRVWLGGDVITGTWVLDALARGATSGDGSSTPRLEPDAVILEGATLEVLGTLAQRARSR
ncbi:lipoyl protein ligase domain-containing protein [Chondromyces crocatus]|uniref:BPL/LPL catalytic domain-containing protein n=1 Tax=Chondromyces crocatus TaxID=52 RepID=A0A0K1ER91_CHOCO|nr:hypothetical protein [Chondromyces crocatus]AKT43450.1 uncharacterized protein CMC5_076820 [Chondromyces crocatus]